jgi:hypothetical protein
MSCFQRLTRQASLAIAFGGGVLATSDIACAARFNQNLQIRQLAAAADADHRQTRTGPLVVGRQLAQARVKTPQPTPAIGRDPSSADFVNKKLNPGPSDPNVPLPRAGLTDEAAESDGLKGTQGVWAHRRWRRCFRLQGAHSGRPKRVEQQYKIW